MNYTSIFFFICQQQKYLREILYFIIYKKRTLHSRPDGVTSSLYASFLQFLRKNPVFSSPHTIP